MGKGDKKSKKGKITNGSYGVTRKRKETAKVVVKPKPKKETTTVKVAPVTEKIAPVKKATPIKKETVKKTPVKKK